MSCAEDYDMTRAARGKNYQPQRQRVKVHGTIKCVECGKVMEYTNKTRYLECDECRAKFRAKG